MAAQGTKDPAPGAGSRMDFFQAPSKPPALSPVDTDQSFGGTTTGTSSFPGRIDLGHVIMGESLQRGHLAFESPVSLPFFPPIAQDLSEQFIFWRIKDLQITMQTGSPVSVASGTFLIGADPDPLGPALGTNVNDNMKFAMQHLHSKIELRNNQVHFRVDPDDWPGQYIVENGKKFKWVTPSADRRWSEYGRIWCIVDQTAAIGQAAKWTMVATYEIEFIMRTHPTDNPPPETLTVLYPEDFQPNETLSGVVQVNNEAEVRLYFLEDIGAQEGDCQFGSPVRVSVRLRDKTANTIIQQYTYSFSIWYLKPIEITVGGNPKTVTAAWQRFPVDFSNDWELSPDEGVNQFVVPVGPVDCRYTTAAEYGRRPVQQKRYLDHMQAIPASTTPLKSVPSPETIPFNPRDVVQCVSRPPRIQVFRDQVANLRRWLRRAEIMREESFEMVGKPK